MEIREQEKRRASNLIWNAAQDYDFEPDFKAFDEDGRADLYWNSIIGAVRKNYDPKPIEDLFASMRAAKTKCFMSSWSGWGWKMRFISGRLPCGLRCLPCAEAMPNG